MLPEKTVELALPTVSAPAPIATLLPPAVTAPVSASEAIVCVFPLRSSLPEVPLMSTAAVLEICPLASSFTTSLLAPPEPSPMVRFPAMAVTFAVLARSSSPAFTVVRPVYVFADAPENMIVPVPALVSVFVPPPMAPLTVSAFTELFVHV